MKELTIDFTGVKYYSEFYKAVKKGLGFPDWCGNNPDAVWDLLTGHIQYPDIIHIKGMSELPEEFYDEARLLLKVLRRGQTCYDDETYELDIIDFDEKEKLKKELTIDFTGVKYYSEFYKAVKKGLGFPDWCGNNPDAVWDLLTGHIQYPDIIHIKGMSELPEEFYDEARLLLKVLRRGQTCYDDETYELDIID